MRFALIILCLYITNTPLLTAEGRERNQRVINSVFFWVGLIEVSFLF